MLDDSARLPWTCSPARATAAVTPVSSTSRSARPSTPPQLARDALAAASDCPGDFTRGDRPARRAVIDHLSRRWDAVELPEQGIPVIGTKEAVASLPTPLGSSGRPAAIPTTAYPTYEVARAPGAGAACTTLPSRASLSKKQRHYICRFRLIHRNISPFQ